MESGNKRVENTDVVESVNQFKDRLDKFKGLQIFNFTLLVTQILLLNFLNFILQLKIEI